MNMNIDRLHRTLHLLRANEIVDFDLSELVIDGKKVFEMGGILGGIPRAEMPQLKGFPRKGSVAAQLEADKNGKVSVMEEFIDYMTNVQGYESQLMRKKASQLKGSQSELVASKIANTVQKLWRNPEHKKFHQTYVASREGILIDGHHGWASVRIFDLLQDIGDDTELIVRQFDCGIDYLIETARTFATVIGIENKEGV
jgi:hypothetical protein